MQSWDGLGRRIPAETQVAKRRLVSMTRADTDTAIVNDGGGVA